eukprot:scaffold947_cov155-Skeletonema_menzelii.AAC.4
MTTLALAAYLQHVYQVQSQSRGTSAALLAPASFRSKTSGSTISQSTAQLTNENMACYFVHAIGVGMY